MNILIMGGTRFVSKSLAIFLIDKGHKVSIFTRNKIPVDYTGIVEHFIGDRKILADLQKIKEIDFDIVFDISAYELLDVKNLFSCLNKISLKRYIFCSSGSVYSPTIEMAKEFSECGYNQNWGEYGLNKLKIEEFLMKEFEKYGLPISIVRPTYIYGKGNVLYREAFFFERIMQQKIIPIPDSDSKIQHIYIDDLLKIFEELMYLDKANGQVFNVTHPEEISWESLVKTAASVVGTEAKIKKVNYVGKLKPREFFPFRDYTYLLSIDKLKEYNVSTPEIDLKKGLELSYNWIIDEKWRISDEIMCKVEEVIKI
ncbi:NAD-dependent epimerase/dehydratase family protein [Anaerosacchariphilus polymeriproducens]|nr:NAD-dependent epimerase/dehydratase family protein [Anaerosacchariphilus polymeriproducens]